MKRSIFIFFIVFIFFSSLYAGGIDVAIMDLEPLGVKKSMALTVSEILRSEFVKNPLFNVLERTRLKSILNEQSLQLSGMTIASKAVEVGKLLNVKKLIFGSISSIDSKYTKYILTLRMVDIESGAIEVSDSIDIPSDDNIKIAVSSIVKKIAKNINIIGTVKLVQDDYVFIDLGESTGISQDDKLSILNMKLIKDRNGKIIMREETPVANIKVVKADKKGSKCEIIKSWSDIKVGMAVKLGEKAYTTPTEKRKGNITVKSYPEGAKAFLDGEFIGLTPVSLKNLETDKYTVEIRMGGYESYKARINLSSGRNIVIEKELEKIVEIEDVLSGIKIPRRTTDPDIAAIKALLPGWGEYYNGYKTLSIVNIFQISGYIGLGYMWLGNKASADKKMNENYPQQPYDFYAVMDYYPAKYGSSLYSKYSLYTIGYAALVYLYSILDSYASADDLFRFVEITELKFGFFKYSSGSTQSDDTFTGINRSVPVPPSFNEMVRNTKGSDVGGMMSLGFRSRRFDLLFEMDITSGKQLVGVESHLKVPVVENFFVIGGINYIGNFNSGRNVEYSKESPASDLNELMAPVIGLSYESYKILFSVDVSPFASGAAVLYHLNNSSDTWTSKTIIKNLTGYYFKGRFDFYFSAKFGLSLVTKYIALADNDDIKEMAKLGLPTIIKHNDIIIYLTPVFRF